MKDIFEKKVDRPIEGVIKADDEKSLWVEVEEYVLTREVSNRLGDFLSAYNNPTSANGVWVSGFFGSGKSHLLKILSLLLENKPIEGKSVLDAFLPKCEDELLKAELKKAAAIPSQSVLFNIDQKADIISKTEIDALLSVFVKVFDEVCGYYGKQPHIAKFERDLDKRGQYETFKSTYNEISGNAWEIGREATILEAENINRAFAKISGKPDDNIKDILSEYRALYKLSIEDFSEQVWDYIKSKPEGFRLNFFVDEVGQYIADNIKLMTNLQTLAESLATKCKGRAWIIVTAQEDMNNVVGEMNKQQANDFSKIQARFANKMKLTSQDVAEVIQKRLLAKTDQAQTNLISLYSKHSNDFKTLFDFSDGSQTYRNFRDQEHFVSAYPFIPYQFTLFQSAIQQISNHNGFEGRHSSVGERSMLGVFQQVAKQLLNTEIGGLATFDLMFEGIRTALKAQIQRSILNAENNLSDEFALKVLKALFLVKYVREFKPSIRNICVLMHDAIDAKVPDLRKRVEKALSLLEQETYIQRNGEFYEFLTDEEKDIEQEIKNTEIDQGAEAEELNKIIFDEVIRERKVRYDRNGQSYSFARKLDDSLHGNRDYELTIHVISPFYEHADNQHVLRSHNLGRDELMVIMGSNDRLLRDLAMYLKTEKYIQQNTRTAQSDGTKKILFDKRDQNNHRKSEILKAVKDSLSKATLFAQGNNLDISASDPQTRIVLGFQELITATYPQLRMLRDITYRDEDISKSLNPSNSLFSEDATNLDEAEQEIFSHIQMQQKAGVRVTLKTLTDKFEKKPYGWYLAAITCTVAKLNTRGKIECQLDSNTLEGKELEHALKNTQAHANLVLKPQQEFSASQIRQLKDFYEEFFNQPPSSSEGKALALEAAQQLKDKLSEIRELAAQKHEFPFLSILEGSIAKLQGIIGKPYDFYIRELGSFGDDLLDAKEHILQPISSFMAGEKRKIYSDAKEFSRKHQHDFIYVDGEESAELKRILDSEDCFKGDKMRRVKELHDLLFKKLVEYLKQLKAQKDADLRALRDKLTSSDKFAGFSEPERSAFTHSFEVAAKQIASLDSIPVIESAFQRFESGEYSNLLAKLESHGSENTKKTAEKQEIVRVKVNFSKALLSTEEDVEAYTKQMKQELLKEIKAGKKVQV